MSGIIAGVSYFLGFMIASEISVTLGVAVALIGGAFAGFIIGDK